MTRPPGVPLSLATLNIIRRRRFSYDKSGCRLNRYPLYSNSDFSDLHRPQTREAAMIFFALNFVYK